MLRAIALIIFGLSGHAEQVPTPEIFRDLQNDLPALNQLSEYKSYDQLSAYEKFKARTGFLTSREDARQSLDQTLLQMRDVLGGSELREVRKTISDEQKQIAEINKTILEDEMNRLQAPREGGLFTKSQSDYDDKIRNEKLDIRTHQNNIRVGKTKAMMILSRQGLTFDDAQLSALLFTCTSDNEVELISAFHSIQVVSEKLKSEAARAYNNHALQNQYLGLHTLSLRALIALQLDYRDKIDKVFLVKLNKIHDEAATQLSTRQTPGTSVEERASYKATKANYEAIVKVADIYKTFLLANRAKLEMSLKVLQNRYLAAENLYFSNQLAGELLSLIDQADQASSVLSLQVPPLDTQITADPALAGKFEELNSRLLQN